MPNPAGMQHISPVCSCPERACKAWVTPPQTPPRRAGTEPKQTQKNPQD